jgi:phospholipase/carboxylesterase
MSDAIVLQLPATQAEQLILMFHGVGGSPDDLAGVGQRLATTFPNAAIISIPGRHHSDFGRGYQWFSVSGVTEENRAARIAEAMPSFTETVREWQKITGVTAHATVLLGFSQGAIMALESTREEQALSARVVSLSGRFAHLPDSAPERTTIHFIHGKSDQVIHYGHAVHAAEKLIALGGDVTADIIPQLGHGVSEEVVDLIVERLQTYLPQRIWREALQSAPAA